MTEPTEGTNGRRRGPVSGFRRAPVHPDDAVEGPNAPDRAGGTTLPRPHGAAEQADDHLEAPGSDEAPARIDLPRQGSGVATSGLFTPGEAETSAPDDLPHGWRQQVRRTSRDAIDFSALRASPYGLGPLLVLGFISFFGRLDGMAFTFAAPEIARSLNIDVGDVISILILVGTIGIFAQVGAGYLLDRVKRTPAIAIGAVLQGIFAFVMGRATTFATLTGPRVANNVGDIVSGIPRGALLGDYYPHDVRGKAFAFLGALRNVAAVGAPLFVGYLLESRGWPFTFKVLAVPLVVMGIISAFVLKEPVRGFFERKALGASDEEARIEEEPLSFAEGFRTTFAIRTVRRRVLADVFSFGALEITGLFFLFWTAEEYGLGPLDRGFLSLPAALFGIFGGLIGGTLVDRYTSRNPRGVLYVIGVFSVVASLVPLLYMTSPPLPVVALAGVFFGFFGSMIGPAAGVINFQVIPANIRVQGLQLTAMSALGSTVLFLPMARVFFADYGYNAVWLFATVLGVIGGLIEFTAAPFFELDMRAAFARASAEREYQRAKAAGKTKLLVARNLDVYYDTVQVLFDVDFDVEEGEILALLGTNGAGKSTVLRALNGVTPARSGGVIFDGRDITHMPPNEIAARGVIQMPGGRGIFPTMSVRENLLLGNWLSEDRAEAKERLDEVFEIFPRLAERLDTPAGTLSGGEQQQLSLAQAFLANPRLLLIDELSLGLSPAIVGELIEIVKEINRRGVTVIVVEQSVNVALTMADKAIFMEKGEVRFYGATEDLLARPDILRAVYVKGTGALTSGPVARRAPVAEADRAEVLAVDGLVKSYGGIAAVRDVSFGLPEGQVLGLIGPNGAGKTTIFDLISGTQRPDAGVVRFQGVDITDKLPEERARLGLIRRFQDARLFPSLTVEETLLIALDQRLEVRNAALNAFRAPQARKSERRVRARADRLIELLEIGAFRDKFVRELSTGLRRVLDLACVLAAEPKVLLLDEPSSGIAQAEAEGLAPLLRRVKFETGCSILIIEHDMPLISSVSDELIALDQGAFVTRGTPEEVLEDERVVEAYLGTTEAAINRSGSLA